MSIADKQDGVFAIEGHSIGYIPDQQRHGNPRDLFTLWFCTSIAPLAVITGAMSILTFKLDVVSAITAIVAGHLFGAIVLALASAQGPLAGIPQMIQSRAQFGRFGSLLVVGFTTLIYLGYFISNIILSGKTLHTVIPAIPVPLATVLGAALATVIGIIGYTFIHSFNRIGIWFMGGALLIGLAIMVPNLSADTLSQGGFTPAGWFSMFGIGCVWQISFSPYTSDYSRALPRSVGVFKPFIYTYLGASLGPILAFAFGMLAVSGGGQTDAMEAVRIHTGGFGYALMILFLVNIIGHNAMNLYGAVLSCVTSLQTFSPMWTPGSLARITLSCVLLAVSTMGALWASSNFIEIFINAVFALLFILAPWVSINLLDFYVVNRGQYDIASIFARDGGRYGLFNGKAMTAYVIGTLVQVPFISNTFFQGPWASLFGGVDVSWIVGLIVSAICYALLVVRSPRHANIPVN
ncbi:cytosine permease [Xanthomonas cassavae CFBP 4642]|uniref:Cytosine permease n=1 Tax=Xanthomonas cassavae CFBP 4642 TaxID=1219375 RepID=A0ABS8HB43_9XANT|nr:cytosine permease [Xanthomonas cassavae]MCC4619366.1 cytosine permease [Xanthomonas cassavae CFBP 4642]